MNDQDFDTLVQFICAMTDSEEDQREWLITLSDIEMLPQTHRIRDSIIYYPPEVK